MTGRRSRKRPRGLIEGDVSVDQTPSTVPTDLETRAPQESNFQEQPWMAIMERLDQMEARINAQQQSQTVAQSSQTAVPTILGDSVSLGPAGGQPLVLGAVAGPAGGQAASAVLSPAVVLSQAPEVPSGQNRFTPSSTNLAGTGMPRLLESINQPTAAQAFGRKPGACLTHKVKAKIWANEYVDFSTLLSEPGTLWQGSLDDDTSSQQRTVVLNRPKSKPLSFNQWLSAFIIFADVVSEKSEKEGAQLWAYLSTIQEMNFKFSQRNAWRLYDEEFRRQRAIAPELHPWAVVNWYYYNSAVFSTAGALLATEDPKEKKKQHPCYNFNNTGICNRPKCPFAHTCIACHGNHSRVNCSQCQQTTSGQSSDGAAKTSS